MSEWGHGDDDELARRLQTALRREAGLVEVPDRYAEVRHATERAEPQRRPWLYAVAAALVLVVGAGLLWQVGLHRATGTAMSAGAAPAAQDRAEQARESAAAAPVNPQAASRAPAGATPTAVAAPSAAPPSRVGAPAVGFATSTGDIVCLMSGTEVVCQSLTVTVWEQSSPLPCPTVPGGGPAASGQGGVSLTAQGASRVCAPEGLARLDLAAKDASTSWYRAGRDTTAPTPYGAVPVLLAGSVATTPNGQRCEVARAGLTCTDPSGAAFSLSRSELTLSGPGGANPTVLR